MVHTYVTAKAANTKTWAESNLEVYYPLWVDKWAAPGGGGTPAVGSNNKNDGEKVLNVFKLYVKGVAV